MFMDATPQFLALIPADDITAERAEVDSDSITTAERLINLLKCSFAYNYGLRFRRDASLARNVVDEQDVADSESGGHLRWHAEVLADSDPRRFPLQELVRFHNLSCRVITAGVGQLSSVTRPSDCTVGSSIAAVTSSSWSRW